jgi:hypothetical protein
MNGIVHFFEHVDEHDNIVRRPKYEYPYSYDGFVTWRGGENKEANATIYIDRLMRSDYEKYNRLCKKHFGNKFQMWFSREPEKIESFLRDWFGDEKLRLILVMEYCNVSSGFPLWRFDYYTSK